MYNVRSLKGVRRDLRRLDPPTSRRVLERIKWFAENPDGVTPEALKGELAGLCKLRVGDYRIFYQMLRAEKIIVIHAVKHRRDAYRGK